MLIQPMFMQNILLILCELFWECSGQSCIIKTLVMQICIDTSVKDLKFEGKEHKCPLQYFY